MSDKSEVEALALLTELLVGTNTSFAFIARPDGDQRYDINIDFLVEIGGEIWAIEVMRLTLDSQWVAAKEKMLSDLQSRLETIAMGSHININLMLAPPLGLNTAPEQESWLSSTCQKVEAAVFRRRGFASLDDGVAQLEYESLNPGVLLLPAFTSTANSQDELNGACGETLAYKLTKQLPAFSQHFDKRGIILDSRQDDSMMPSFFPISEHTVRGLLNHVQSSSEITNVDGAWWISTKRSIQSLL